jgi:O-antigen/teichoic acid export membrane protein
MAAAAALGLLKGIFFAKVLGAQGLGYYGLVMIVTQFGTYLSNWGILSALNNQLPMALGRGDADVDEIVGRSLGALLASTGITAALYVAIVTALAPADRDVWVALSLAAVVTAATTVCEFHFLLLRVQRRLLPLASMYLLRAIAAIALGVGAGALWGYRGVIVSEFVALALAIWVARRRWLPHVLPAKPTRERTLWLIRWGAPLLIANVIVTLSFAVDRVFVAAALPDELGQYIFASFAVVAWLAVSGMLGQAVAPQLLYEYGAGESLRRVRAKALRVSGLVAGLGIGGLLALLAVRGRLADGIFSDYGPGLDAMPILYLGGLVSLLAFPGFLLHALRPELSLLAAGLGAMAAVTGGVVLATRGAGLNDFAWLFVTSQVVVTAVILVAVEWLTRHPAAVSRAGPG